jgi:hypothetical protein
MKVRTIAITLAFALASPFTAPILSGWELVPVAHAQDKKTELAREKFNEGVAAYDAGQFEKARTLFLQAYALKRHPLVLLNLGQSELKSGHVEDGGNHLQQFLREHDSPTAQQKKDADAGVAEAQRKTGYVIFIVDQDGSDLAIDGVTIGTSPLSDPYFVSPGKHEVTATKGKHSDKATFDAKKGSATSVTLTLGGGSVAIVPAPVPSPDPVPQPTPNPVVVPSPIPDPVPNYQPTPTPIPPPMGPPITGGDTGREGLIPWFTHRPLAWVLFGLAGAGLIGTVAFGAAAGSADAAASDVSDQIISEVKRGEEDKTSNAHLPDQYWSDGDGTGEPQPCGSEDNPESGYAYYRDACDQLRDNIDAYDADLIGLGVSAAVGVAALAGLTVYYFVDSDDSAGHAGSIMLVPAIGKDGRGAALVGEF